MTEKFKNQYRIASARLQTWDYSWEGAYFVTICTHQKAHHFGTIIEGQMHLSHTGLLADVFWHEIKNHAQNVKLGAFVVMPNHVHGLLLLNQNGSRGNKETENLGKTRFQNQGKNTVSSMIGGYKAAVTKHAHRLGHEFQWQTRFHDHIIRNHGSYCQIEHYILSNPQNWEKDKFYGVEPLG